MPTSCAAASAVTAASGVIRARRAGAKTHSFARSSRVENHRHRRTGVIARVGVPSENDSTREVAASSDASGRTRRDALFAFAVVAATAGVSAATAFAEEDTTSPSGADGTTGGENEPLLDRPSSSTEPAPKEPVPSQTPVPNAVPPVRYKGANWSVICPGSYERKPTEKPRRVYEQRADCEPNCRDLQAKRTEETPLVARFGSADDSQDISVSLRGANTLKLTFLQIKDVTEFGDVREAAPLFVPSGATVLGATARTESVPNGPNGESVDKAYYAYDFEFGSARVLLTAAVEAGNVYLVGCTASKEAWAEAEPGFKRASNSFRVGPGPDKAISAEKKSPAPSAAKEVDLPAGRARPAEQMNCRGPLPIFCSVDAE